MSEDIYSQYLRFAVDESAFSTFTEGPAILTGASVNRIQAQNIALEIHAISVTLNFPEDLPASGGTESVDFCLSTRADLGAMPQVDAEHVIYKNRLEIRAGVAVYLPLIMMEDRFMPHHLEFKHPLLISHPKIFPYIQSTNSSAVAWARGYIMFTYVLLSPDMALEALESFR